MRNVIAFFLFGALTITLCLRTFISMSILLMVRTTPANYTEIFGNDTSLDLEAEDDGLLDWKPEWKPLVFSVPLVGTVIALLFYFKFVADRVSPTRVVLVSIIIQSVLSLISPPVARASYIGFLMIRFCLGFVEGFTISSFNTIAVNWFPANERALKLALYTCGYQVSFGVAQYVVSAFAQLGLPWTAAFYIFGSAGLVFAVLWFFIVSDAPASSRWAGAEEKEMLLKAIPHTASSAANMTKRAIVPWSSILTSRVVAVHLACMGGVYFAIGITTAFLPTYFREELALPISYNGIFTAAPFISQIAFKLVAGAIVDWFKTHRGLSQTVASKICQSLSGAGFATLFALPFVSSHAVTFAILILYGASNLFVVGFYTSMTMIAPRFTGSISAVHFFVGALCQLLSTALFTALTHMGTSYKFYISFGISALWMALATAAYLLWGAAELQPWAREENIITKEKKKAREQMKLLA